MKPYWILRHHGSSSIRSLQHLPESNLLAAGDDNGQVSIVDLSTLRPRFSWKAHEESILTVLLVGPDQVVTHARDNTVKLWRLPERIKAIGGDGGKGVPELVREVGVNALNFSKLSHDAGQIAVPNTLDAAYIDILDLRSGLRTHEAIGRPDIKPSSGRLPIVMSLHLLPDSLGVVAGYEDGWVKRWTLDGELVWQTRCHSESVMSTSISLQHNFGISVGADDRLAHFDLTTGECKLAQTKTPGKASSAIAPDGRSFVVGGWDGSVKVYKTEGMQELGELRYHRDTVECLAFAYARTGDDDDGEEDDEEEEEQKGEKASELILAAGGRDGKISLWKYH